MGFFNVPQPRPNPPLFPSPFVPSPYRSQMQALVDRLTEAQNNYADRIAAMSGPPKLHRGDKVRVTVDGYIDDVDGDSYVITETRQPFSDYADTQLLIVAKRDDIGLVERAPAAPRVGDNITGEHVRATPWRAGTILNDGIESFMLGVDGQWVSCDTGDSFPFAEFTDYERFRVVYAPGKKTR